MRGWRIRTSRLGKRRSGSFVVLFALLNTVLFAFAALAIDVSYVRSLFGQMQRSADAACHSLMVAFTHGGNSGQGMAIAQSVAQANPVAGQPVVLSSANFTFGVWDFSTNTFSAAASGNAARLDYSAPISLLFGPLIGRSTSTGVVRSTVAMRPRELVFVVDVSTLSDAPSRPAAYQDLLAEMYRFQNPNDHVSMVLYNSAVLGSGGGTLYNVVNNYVAIDTQWSHLGACGTGMMPGCVNGSDPGLGVNRAVSLFQNFGDSRNYQAIYLLTPGDIRCTNGLASCATGLKNQVVTAVDAAWALGISVFPVAVQATSSNAAFLDTLRRGDGLKSEMYETTVVADLDVFLPLIGDHVPLAIVE